MRILDLGCGRGASSIFLHSEFGVQVWATDLWFRASTNACNGSATPAWSTASFRSTPTRGRCRSRAEFFDAIVSIDSFPYYGTDDLYLNYLARFVQAGRADRHRGRGSRRRGRAPGPRASRRLVGAQHRRACTPRTGGGGTGNAPASSTSCAPTRCPTAGSCGGTGSGSSRPTTPSRSRRSRRRGPPPRLRPGGRAAIGRRTRPADHVGAGLLPSTPGVSGLNHTLPPARQYSPSVRSRNPSSTRYRRRVTRSISASAVQVASTASTSRSA